VRAAGRCANTRAARRPLDACSESPKSIFMLKMFIQRNVLCYAVHRWKRIRLSIVRWYNRTFKAMYCTVHCWKRICTVYPLYVSIIEHSKPCTVCTVHCWKSICIVRYHTGGSMKLNACVLHLPYMVFL
jgi:hypothetical protein